LDEIVANAMILFRHNDLGTKIDTSLNREIKKDGETAEADAPLQLRLRLLNRFNMDLNNVYAMEFIPDKNALIVETSVNVYHDDFNLEDFTGLLLDVLKDPLKGVDIQFIANRFEYNFRNIILHWKAAKEKQFIIDPQVDRLKQMHDIFMEFLDLAKAQNQKILKAKADKYLTVSSDIVLEKRKFSYAKSRILKIIHRASPKKLEELKNKPQSFVMLLLEYCLVPLFLANELYIMSLIYKRNLEDIRTVLRKRVQET